MLKISVGKICTLPKFKGGEKLLKYFRVLDPNRHFDPAYKMGRWNGYYQFLRPKVDGNYYFQVGLLQDVVKLLKSWGHEVEFKIGASTSAKAIPFNSELFDQGFMVQGKLVNLRPYQRDAVLKMNKKLIGVIELPTSAGKTEIMLDYAKSHPTAKFLYVCSQTLLAAQTVKRAETYLAEPVGQMFSSSHRGLDSRFVCCVNKSLKLRLKSFAKDRFDVVFYDECHSTSATTKDILSYFNWKRLYGFTGSYPSLQYNPVKHWQVRSTVGPPIYSLDEKQFNLDSDFIPDIKIYIVDNQVTISPMSSFSRIYADLKADNGRNILIGQLAGLFKSGILIIVNHTDHGLRLEKVVKGWHPETQFIDAKQGKLKCQQAIEDLDSGQLKVLISTPLIDTGVSINNIRCFINAAGWKSEIKLIQRVGRGKRTKTSGDNSLVILDLMDKGHKRCRMNAIQRLEVYKKFISDNVVDKLPIEKLKSLVLAERGER